MARLVKQGRRAAKPGYALQACTAAAKRVAALVAYARLPCTRGAVIFLTRRFGLGTREMAGLRPPERDIGIARAPRWSGRALLGIFGAILLILALLERLGLHSIAAAPAVVVLALALFAGAAMLSPARRSTDYYVADREMTPARAGAAVAGTVGGLLIVGATGGSFETNGDVLGAAAGLLLGCVLVGLLLAPRLRRSGGHTAGDFLTARFGPRARLACAAVAFGSSFLILTASLSIAGPLLASFVELTPRQGLLAAAAVTAAAVLPGGMRSLIAVQGLQFAIAIAACLVPVAVTTFQSGALPTMNFGGFPLSDLDPEGPAGMGLLIGLGIPVLLAGVQTAALPQMLAVGLSAPSGRAATAAFGWGMILSLALILAAMFFGYAALEAAGAPADDISAELILLGGPPLDGLPAGLAGLAVAGALAMLLSLGQAALFSATSALSHDVWDEILDRRAVVEQRIFAARILAIAITAAAAWPASQVAPNPSALLGWGLALAAAGGVAPLLLGLWWRRCNTVGALAGAICGGGIVIGSFILDPGGSVVENAAFVGVLGSFSATLLVSLLTPAPSADQADLVRRLRRGGSRIIPGTPASGVGRTPRAG